LFHRHPHDLFTKLRRLFLNRLRALFHPIFVFVGVQIAWIILMGIWIYWYVRNSQKVMEFAEKLKPELLMDTNWDWVILAEGCFLMLIILAGVYVIFVYWTKQTRLNRLHSNFVSSVSHELKSPLASLQLYLETMKYRKVTEQDAREFVEMMLADTERLSGLIDNILQSSRTDAKSMQFQFEPISIHEFLSDVLNRYQRQFDDRHFKVSFQVDSTPTLQLDKRAMRMVFNNLIGNALRYSSTNSSFTVRLFSDKKFCYIEFTDEGVGLSKKEINKIFKKFYRVQEKDTQNIEGAGLGLFISREIVKKHKGKINAFSEGRGKGVTFTITLPLTPEKKDKAKP